MSVARPGAGELDRCLAGDGAECELGAAIGAMSSLAPESDWRGRIVFQEGLSAKCPVAKRAVEVGFVCRLVARKRRCILTEKLGVFGL